MAYAQQALQALPMSITARHGASNITCDEGAFVATIHESLLLNSDDHAGLKVYDVNVDMCKFLTAACNKCALKSMDMLHISPIIYWRDSFKPTFWSQKRRFEGVPLWCMCMARA